MNAIVAACALRGRIFFTIPPYPYAEPRREAPRPLNLADALQDVQSRLSGLSLHPEVRWAFEPPPAATRQEQGTVDLPRRLGSAQCEANYENHDPAKSCDHRDCHHDSVLRQHRAASGRVLSSTSAPWLKDIDRSHDAADESDNAAGHGQNGCLSLTHLHNLPGSPARLSGGAGLVTGVGESIGLIPEHGSDGRGRLAPRAHPWSTITTQPIRGLTVPTATVTSVTIARPATTVRRSNVDVYINT